MQKFLRMFSAQTTKVERQTYMPLMQEKEQKKEQKKEDLDPNDLKKMVESFTNNDKLHQYITISNTEYLVNGADDDIGDAEEDAMYQIRRLKTRQNIKIPKNSLILFKASEYDDDKQISGCIDDKCSYNGDILIGMIEEQHNLMKNVDIDIKLCLYQDDRTIDQRDLAASYIKHESNDQYSTYDQWRFWLITKKEGGFYKDFTQDNTYMIFPTHSSYDMLKTWYMHR